jgi:hypothetical protein
MKAHCSIYTLRLVGNRIKGFIPWLALRRATGFGTRLLLDLVMNFTQPASRV